MASERKNLHSLAGVPEDILCPHPDWNKLIIKNQFINRFVK